MGWEGRGGEGKDSCRQGDRLSIHPCGQHCSCQPLESVLESVLESALESALVQGLDEWGLSARKREPIGGGRDFE